MNRRISKTLAATMMISLAAAGCAQAPADSPPRQASVSSSVPAEVSPAPSTEDNPDRLPDNNPGGGSSSAIGRDQAIAIALGQTGGGNVDEVENEFEHGRAAWKVRIINNGNRFSVYIDKATGEVIRLRDEGRD